VATRPDASRVTVELIGPSSKASWNEALSTPRTGSVKVTLIPWAVSTPSWAGSCVAIAGAIASGVGAALGLELELGAVDGAEGVGLDEIVSHATIAPVSSKQAHMPRRLFTSRIVGHPLPTHAAAIDLGRDDRTVRV
jgi:hypothetical protein